MKTPTDEEIESLCAAACHRILFHIDDPDHIVMLLRVVLDIQRDLTFERHVNQFAIAEASAQYGHVNSLCTSFWTLLASPRLVATAALLALDKWPKDWTLPPQVWPREYQNL